MSVRQYIGARYVTKIYENSLDPSSAEWEQGTFEPLVMVTWQNSTYLSKKQVPGSIGDPANNPSYWVCTGYYNGQIMQLQNDVADLYSKVSYDTFTDLIADVDTRSDGDIVTTRGYATPGIGAGIYQLHTSSAPHYIQCGSMYAELLFNDVVDFDALGPGYGVSNFSQTNTELMETAFALILNRYPVVNVAGGHVTGAATIKLGDNEYRFNSAITIPTNTAAFTIEGADNGSSVIAYNGGSPLFTIGSRTDGNANSNIHFKRLLCIGAGGFIAGETLVDCSIEDCQFINNSNTSVTILAGSVNVNIVRCLFYGCSTYALYISDMVTTTNIVECFFSHCDKGLTVDGNGSSNGINVLQTIFEYSTTYGFNVASASHVTLRDLWVEGNDNLISNSNIILDNLNTSLGPNGESAYITVNTTINTRIYATNVTTDLRFTTLVNVKGLVQYEDGAEYDIDRKRITVKGDTNLAMFTSNSYGFIDLHSDDGNFFGSYVFDQGNDFTITKIAGSIAALACNANGVLEVGSATNPVMTFTY